MAGWSLSPALFADQVEKDLVEMQRHIVIELVGEIISNAPVDSGAYMANNIVTIGSPSYDISQAVDISGQPTFAAATSALSDLKPFSTVYVQNNEPYGELLEFGGYNGPSEKVTFAGYSRMSPMGVYGISFIAVTEKWT
ncbi:hypothetical protein M2396_002708 [Pseudomonas sp. BIGb0278]|uniref:HK97 gp10 family phage protein n=1 Tax=Pseudomonas sp. BIGb0278 TaxID=2940607 RepID=UPI002169CE5C|nr:HK97 gp10 family phage protein [Pseudomonas sp. BIGb0278]MCS4284412.1 hypothetical protein [Pseudomonas sp. BIGb0278]